MNRNESLFRLFEWLTDPPQRGPVPKWFMGVFLPTLLVVHGSRCAWLQQATVVNAGVHGFRYGTGFWREVTGPHAMTFGWVVLCIGLFMHFQWFWGNHRHLEKVYEVPKFAMLWGTSIAFLAHAYTMIVYT